MTRRKQLGAGGNPEQGALTPAQVQQMQFEGTLNLIREMALNPNVDPDKLSKILDLQERVMDKSAEQQFNDAMHKAQEEMSFVATDSENQHKHNRYASYKALDKQIRPIYTKHGFSVSFDTGPGREEYGPIPDGHIRVLMDIAHSAGWRVQKHADIPVETTGSEGGKVMTRTHATGSGMSYGKRYLLIFGFNLAVGEHDDDGNAAGGGKKPGGGKDHRFKDGETIRNVESKSGSKKGAGKKAEDDGERLTLKAAKPDDRITPSNVTTIRAQMKRDRVSDQDFVDEFGIKLEEVGRGDIGKVVDKLKEWNK